MGSGQKNSSAFRFLLYWYLSWNLHSRFKSARFVHRFGWWLSNNILVVNEKFSLGTLVSHLSRQAVWKPNLTSVSKTHRLRIGCRSLFNRQSPVAAHSPYAISPPCHARVDATIAKEPHVVTVLAASARLKHWRRCHPLKCWSRFYAGSDLCHQFSCSCSST